MEFCLYGIVESIHSRKLIILALLALRLGGEKKEP